MKSARFVEVSRAGPSAVVAVLITLGLAIFLAAAPRPFGPVAEPWLHACVIYFWTHRRPSMMPPLLCFVAGLLTDLITGGPIGLWALSLTGLSLAARVTRPLADSQPWPKRMGYFALSLVFMILVASIALGAAGVSGGAPLAGMAIHALTTLIIYIPLESLLAFIAGRVGLRRGAL